MRAIIVGLSLALICSGTASAGEVKLIEEQSSWAPDIFGTQTLLDREFDSLPAAQAKAVGYMMSCDPFVSSECEKQFEIALVKLSPTGDDYFDTKSVAVAYQGTGVDLTFAGSSEYGVTLSTLASR